MYVLALTYILTKFKNVKYTRTLHVLITEAKGLEL